MLCVLRPPRVLPLALQVLKTRHVLRIMPRVMRMLRMMWLLPSTPSLRLLLTPLTKPRPP